MWALHLTSVGFSYGDIERNNACKLLMANCLVNNSQDCPAIGRRNILRTAPGAQGFLSSIKKTRRSEERATTSPPIGYRQHEMHRDSSSSRCFAGTTAALRLSNAEQRRTIKGDFMRRFLLVGTMALGSGLIAVQNATAATCTTASTTSCTIDLTVTNISNGLLATGGNYGTVSLTLDGNLIDVVVTMTAGYGLHNADFGWNGTHGGTDSISGPVTYTFAGSDPGAPTFTATGYGNMDGFGAFVAGFNGGTGSSSLYTSLTFSVASSVPFTAVGQLLAGNNQGSSNFFAGQISVIGLSGCTGFVGNTGSTQPTTTTNTNCTPVPDGGATLGLLGMAMLGLGYLRRRIV